MFFVLFELGHFIEVAHPAIDPHPHKTLAAQLVEHVQVLALAVADDGRQQQQPAVFRHGDNLIHHLADGLRRQRYVVLWAARLADAGIKQAQVIVDFGDGADGGAGVVRGGFLFDGDGRGEALDMFHVRLFHHGQKLARVGRQRFHIAALTLGVEGVEGQGGFSRPG